MKWQDRLGSCNIIDARHIDAEEIEFQIKGSPEHYAALPFEVQESLTAVYKETLANMAAAIEPGGLNGEPCREIESEAAPMAIMEGGGITSPVVQDMLDSIRDMGRDMTRPQEGHVIIKSTSPQSDPPYAPETSPIPPARPWDF